MAKKRRESEMTDAPLARIVWHDITGLKEFFDDEEVDYDMLVRFETIGRARMVKPVKEPPIWIVTMEQAESAGDEYYVTNPPITKLIPDAVVDEVIWLEEKKTETRRKKSKEKVKKKSAVEF